MPVLVRDGHPAPPGGPNENFEGRVQSPGSKELGSKPEQFTQLPPNASSSTVPPPPLLTLLGEGKRRSHDFGFLWRTFLEILL